MFTATECQQVTGQPRTAGFSVWLDQWTVDLNPIPICRERFLERATVKAR